MPAPRTTSQYFRTPEAVIPQELIDGMVRESAASPRPEHQAAVGAFHVELMLHVRPHRLGSVFAAPIDVVLDADRGLVLQPDLIFISSHRAHIIGDRIRGAPDIALDVLSPDPRLGRADERVDWFARYGVRECWLLNLPRRTLGILQLARTGVRDRRLFCGDNPITSAVLPSFEASVEEVLDWIE